jgi:hypothetical protein
VHDRAENARLLISAHKSAKTYGEQLRELIAAQVVLFRVKRTLDASADGSEHVLPLAAMIGYLTAMHDEYRREYKEVSDLQLYDQTVTGLRFDAAAKRDPPRKDTPEASRGAWARLEDEARFPVLTDFCHGGDSYKMCFLAPFVTLASGLLKGRGVTVAAGFDKQVKDVADGVVTACTAGGGRG